MAFRTTQRYLIGIFPAGKEISNTGSARRDRPNSTSKLTDWKEWRSESGLPYVQSSDPERPITNYPEDSELGPLIAIQIRFTVHLSLGVQYRLKQSEPRQGDSPLFPKSA